ncbi:MAG: hypothetical protein H6Q10_2433 [Acidobacteria bacterium]|nr:hypothetical protein [Acidobacteriota bacterium]
MPMNSGSIAIADIAEYGEVWPTATSLIGSSCSRSWPAATSHLAKRGMSGISPTPQLAREGIEKSGTTTPPWRPASGKGCVTGAPFQNPDESLAISRDTPSANAAGSGRRLSTR